MAFFWNSASPTANTSSTISISGSTLIASEETNRICYTIELDPKFVDVIVKRYIELRGSSDNVYILRNGEKIAYKDINVD